LADKATDKVQGGIHIAQKSAKGGGDALSSKVADVHNKAAPIIRKGSASALIASSLSIAASLAAGFDDYT